MKNKINCDENQNCMYFTTRKKFFRFPYFQCNIQNVTKHVYVTNYIHT